MKVAVIIGHSIDDLVTHCRNIHNTARLLPNHLPAYANCRDGFKFMGIANGVSSADSLAIDCGISGTYQSRGCFSDDPQRRPRYYLLHS